MSRFFWTVPLALSLAVVGVVAFTATAFAQGAVGVAPSSSLIDIARPLYDAFAGGHYAYAASLLVIIAVAAIRQYAGTGKFARWVHSDAGGTLMALIAASAGALAAALAAPGATVTWMLLKSALLVGIGAAGGYTALKAVLVEPLVRPLYARLPAQIQPLFRAVLWIFDKKDFAALDAAASKPTPSSAPPAPPAQSQEKP